jgi:hypothetical protein
MQYLAWPLGITIIVIVGMVIFKAPLERLIDRTKKITKSGLDTTTPTTAASQETGIERRATGAEEMLEPFVNSLVLEHEEAIRKELNNRRVDDPAERERVLIRHLAASVIYNRFDQIYQYIFGSQISALQELNPIGTMAKDDLETTYMLAAAITAPEFYQNYSFDQWLNFLSIHGLVRMDDVDKVTITVAGREFLKFLIQDGRSFSKNG